MMKNRTLLLITILALAAVLTACSGSASDPAKAVENYWKALIAKDSAALSSSSCADYEATALTTLESFQSVEVVIKDLACTAGDPADDSAVVTCTGSIIASYGAEDLVIDLSQRSYNAVKEGGDWRMCGEQ